MTLRRIQTERRSATRVCTASRLSPVRTVVELIPSKRLRCSGNHDSLCESSASQRTEREQAVSYKVLAGAPVANTAGRHKTRCHRKETGIPLPMVSDSE